MKLKNRYSIPAKLVELLWTDDEFFREVSNLKKASTGGKFPRNDQWSDEDGFHICFALAGYSSADVEIVSVGNVLNISGSGLADNIKSGDAGIQTAPQPVHRHDAFEEYTKDTRPTLQQGNIIRGIARRRFNVKFLISEEFDSDRALAVMKNGLLHIVVPECEPPTVKNIKIDVEG